MTAEAVEPIVSTEVVEEHGRFVVLLHVVFADGVVGHRMGDYHSRARAEMAARIIKSTAERQAPADWGMS